MLDDVVQIVTVSDAACAFSPKALQGMAISSFASGLYFNDRIYGSIKNVFRLPVACVYLRLSWGWFQGVVIQAMSSQGIDHFNYEMR